MCFCFDFLDERASDALRELLRGLFPKNSGRTVKHAYESDAASETSSREEKRNRTSAEPLAEIRDLDVSSSLQPPKNEPNQALEPTTTMRPFSKLSFAAVPKSFFRVVVAHLER